MAKKIFGMGILALALVFGMTVVGCDDGSTNDGNGKGGIFTLTDIPTAYNGKYVVFRSERGEVPLVGCTNILTNDDGKDFTFIVPQISDGKVIIPVWLYDEILVSFSKYNGNAKDVYLEVSLLNEAAFSGFLHEIITINFEHVNFSNGNAEKSWNDGILTYFNGDKL
jgi:hypothetical protein